MDNQVLERKTIGEYRYEVFLDPDYDLDIHFEDEQERQDYVDKFEKGELTSFGVVKSKVCKCCSIWSEVDSLWGIHTETADEALEDYLTHCNDGE